jgi:flagellar biosynthesis protein FlhA
MAATAAGIRIQFQYFAGRWQANFLIFAAPSPNLRNARMSETKHWTNLVLPVAIIACVMVILVPLPPALLDILLAANITVAVIVLLTAVQVKSPLEFAVFPVLLLATTLSRVVLNIATTRLILSNGAADGPRAAGGVIQAFGEFVAGHQIMVGAVIFLIILVVQFVVITKGATRISEVAARFMLDAMPGRQIAIDADVAAGNLDRDTARIRREELQSQADFYGAMDGASKYVRGDAIAGLLITAINIIGGLAIGIGHGMSLPQASDVFMRLTIGDGLVSQVPGLLISLAAGILISRSTRATNLSEDFVAQLFRRPQVLVVAGIFLFALIFTQLPTVPLLAVGSACILIAVTGGGKAVKRESDRGTANPEGASAVRTEPDFSRFLAVDPIEIELGVNLVAMANGGELLHKITRARQAIADELGVVLPKVRVRDNLQLDPHQFQVCINQLPVYQAMAYPDRILLVRKTVAASEPDGIPCDWPTGCGAAWVLPDSVSLRGREFLRLEPADVIVETLKAQARERAAEILTRQSTAFLIEQLRESHPATVNELVPELMKIGGIQQVLQNLLSEGVTIKPLNTILEALSDYFQPGMDTAALSELVRSRLSPWITARLRDEAGVVRVVELDGHLQMWLGGRAVVEQGQRRLTLDDHSRALLTESLGRLFQNFQVAALVVPVRLRAPLQRLLLQAGMRVFVTTREEISRDSKIETIAILELEQIQYLAA